MAMVVMATAAAAATAAAGVCGSFPPEVPCVTHLGEALGAVGEHFLDLVAVTLRVSVVSYSQHQVEEDHDR